MKSLCIKVNNTYIIKYLTKEFSNLSLENTYISLNTFKIYDNIIIHYTGKESDIFYKTICDILANLIIDYYEPLIVKFELNKDFCYFSNIEKKRIIELFNSEVSSNIEYKTNSYLAIYNSFYKYITKHHSLVLDGFINFRLYEYRELLSFLLSICVNNYLIEREYLEFINMLRLYIDSSPSTGQNLELLYSNNHLNLYDENNNKINIYSTSNLNAKFLSDISFSDNDYILNYLLNHIPNSITLYPIDESYKQDEFITTLRLIFQDRLKISNFSFRPKKH